MHMQDMHMPDRRKRMSRKYNTLHPDRGRSRYSRKKKAVNADKYGYYQDGTQKAADKIAGKTSIQHVERIQAKAQGN
jgi:hypothetical protein